MGISDELRKYADEAVKRPDYMAGLTFDLERIADRIDAKHEQIYAGLPQMYAEIPVDADGVPIWVGDVMEFGEVGRVQHLELWDDGGWVVVVEYEPGHFTRWHPSSCHHHNPTVEDVLREFVSEFNRDDTELCDEEIIERFAAKLRLADDGEE